VKGDFHRHPGADMSAFSPELAAYWQAENELREQSATEDAVDSDSDQAALEELAERINAARSIV